VLFSKSLATIFEGSPWAWLLHYGMMWPGQGVEGFEPKPAASCVGRYLRCRPAHGCGAVGLVVVHDWVLRFNARGPAGRIDGKATGKLPKLNDAQRPALARIVESGTILAVHGVVRWCWKDLASDIRRVRRLA